MKLTLQRTAINNLTIPFAVGSVFLFDGHHTLSVPEEASSHWLKIWN